MVDTATKEHAHELLDRIAPAQVAAVVDLMEKMLDPISSVLSRAPFEDEGISEEEELAVAGAKSEMGPGTSMEDLLGEYGLTFDELARLKLPPLPSHRDNA